MRAASTLLARRLVREVEMEATAHDLVRKVVLDPTATNAVRRDAAKIIQWIGQSMTGKKE